MYNFKIPAVFLICSLQGLLEQFRCASDTSSVPVGGLVHSIVKEEMPSTISPVASSSGQVQHFGSSKRSREITLGAGDTSSPPSCRRVVLDLNKQPKKESESLDEISTCQQKTQSDWESWKNDLLRFEPDPQRKIRLRMKIDNVINVITDIFQKRMVELAEANRKSLSARDPSQSSLETLDGLACVADSYEIWEPFLRESKNETWDKISTIKHGCDLMIDVFIDLQKHQIVPNDHLALFLNKENRGKLILAYAMGRFPRRTKQFVRVPYVNFNLKLSLWENPSTRKMAGILKLLDQKTWQYIEFEHLQNQLWKEYPMIEYSSPDFNHLKLHFLTQASPHKELTGIEVEDLLEKLITHILKIELSGKDEFVHEKFVHYKQLYDMVGFLMEYNKHKISHEFKQKHSEDFKRIAVFEEAVGLVSSMILSVFIRLTDAENQQQEKFHHLDLLSDLNQNRAVSRFNQEGDIVGNELKKRFENLPNAKEYLESFLYRIKPTTSRIVLHKDLTKVDDSINKFKQQFKRYYIRIRNLIDENQACDQMFIKTIRNFTYYSANYVFEYEQRWGAMADEFMKEKANEEN
ncbi:hypothetical protein PGTUg99_022220 [Puccinia graminis f. sp. tritici]|uniref:Uncharacterized protein n=1 Tax=Puccinia graminis f. sp. tritici TaxID=56615 RepID=A0A5B0NCM9_PUCGR|nr:hypothetical protein PGTUg99_022220 [Puccinia graminis f. sp. tritici]